jgi:ribonuclease T2
LTFTALIKSFTFAVIALMAFLIWHGVQNAALKPEAQVQSAAPFRNFDFYVFSLSWSPAFCALGGGRRDEEQCASGTQTGFVIHGLWPQYQRGYPEYCARGKTRLSSDMLDDVKDIFPSRRLARHQWQKHGTCTGHEAIDYFDNVRRVRDKVIIPPLFKQRIEPIDVAPTEIERVFMDSNQGLQPDMIKVTCRKGLLKEVRLCFDKSAEKFQSCGTIDEEGCRSNRITINAMP